MESDSYYDDDRYDFFPEDDYPEDDYRDDSTEVPELDDYDDDDFGYSSCGPDCDVCTYPCE